jgi:hypothetical protein
VPPAAVLIASSDLLPALEERAGVDGEALRFSDAQPLEALEAITLSRPSLVVLERFFAATPRGAALINRIKADPGCASVEIRVLSHTGDYSRVIVRPAAAPPAPSTPHTAPSIQHTALSTQHPAPSTPHTASTTAYAAAQSTSPSSAGTTTATVPTPATTRPPHLDWRGTRRHQRFRLRDGIVAQVEGKDAAVLDLSAGGAHVVSATALRPNQKVRVSLPLEPEARLRATVAWASFELPKGSGGPRYRAGLEFNDTDPRIAGFAERNRRD